MESHEKSKQQGVNSMGGRLLYGRMKLLAVSMLGHCPQYADDNGADEAVLPFPMVGLLRAWRNGDCPCMGLAKLLEYLRGVYHPRKLPLRAFFPP